jgi:hypothetical protein
MTCAKAQKLVKLVQIARLVEPECCVYPEHDESPLLLLRWMSRLDATQYLKDAWIRVNDVYIIDAFDGVRALHESTTNKRIHKDARLD